MKEIDSLMTSYEVAKYIGMSRSNIYTQIDKGKFPRPIRLSKCVVRCRKKDIDKWFRERVREALY